MSSEAVEFVQAKWQKLIDQLEAQSTRTKANCPKKLGNNGPYVYVDRRRYVEPFTPFDISKLTPPNLKANSKES
ncbi:Oidioi.mRNA.OKI2018_I69.chr2.g5913.t1.cds [Oikopleura dioica]|uniref:Oidioi.mRNA.OKI2018_I69.chr2.g5913.t1.cds n=1 Tax=Oikopleura dioica TaxID=34765 RepID=A0ABN7T3K0_OIKDI|nr:Oidioi.mRNA.OKI2018_I69.chr2.g5913.t1.cds [Oikopleura dioica]